MHSNEHEPIELGDENATPIELPSPPGDSAAQEKAPIAPSLKVVQPGQPSRHAIRRAKIKAQKEAAKKEAAQAESVKLTQTLLASAKPAKAPKMKTKSKPKAKKAAPKKAKKVARPVKRLAKKAARRPAKRGRKPTGNGEAFLLVRGSKKLIRAMELKAKKMEIPVAKIWRLAASKFTGVKTT